MNSLKKSRLKENRINAGRIRIRGVGSGRRKPYGIKRVFVLLCVISFLAELTACSLREIEKERRQEPELRRIQEICELSVLKRYYHNVAKSVKEPGAGVVHFGEKERPFWIEYTGIIEISFPVDSIKMDLKGTELSITLPEPEVTCRLDLDSWNEDSYVIAKDQWIQKNPITAEDQNRVIAEAQADMLEKEKNNQAILDNAEDRARELIENYIDEIKRETGMEYHISWEEEDTGSAEKQQRLEGEKSENGGMEKE